MTLFNRAEIESKCLHAGFSIDNAKIASAIAMCESPSGTDSLRADSDSIGDIELQTDYWGPSVGLFQVRSIKAQKGTGGLRDYDRLLNPEENCRAALTIWSSSGFGAWSTYTSGMYKAYLQDIYPPEPGTYIVLAGDTISKIALKYKIAWQDLAITNNLKAPYRIFIGQVIHLYYYSTYQVAAGDTLTSIAKKFNTTWQKLAEYNHLSNPNHIHPGQVLRIPR